jgi:hypothetical protein
MVAVCRCFKLFPEVRPGYDSERGSAPRCTRCGEVIGVYERLIQVAGSRVRTTSRAADPAAANGSGALIYHIACYRPPSPTRPAAA